MWQCVLTACGNSLDAAVGLLRLLSLAPDEGTGRSPAGKLEKRREKSTPNYSVLCQAGLKQLAGQYRSCQRTGL